MIKIKMIDEFSFYYFDSLEDQSDLNNIIEVNEEEIKQIGLTKKYDKESQKLVDFTRPKANPIFKYNKLIQEYKQKLSETDYKYFKFVDGEIPEAEYKEIQAQRKEWRKEINALEEKIAKL